MWVISTGFLDHIANKKVDVVRMYLPPDANCLLSCMDHCLKSKNYVNVIVASLAKNPCLPVSKYPSSIPSHMCSESIESITLPSFDKYSSFSFTSNFASYEAFIRIVDSMAAQHAKWLKVCNEINWRMPISSLNFLLASNVWQQDHNGFTHQDPGFF